MTTATKPDVARPDVVKPDSRSESPRPTMRAIAGASQALARHPLRTKEAEVPGRGLFRFRELYQAEREDIDAPLNQTEVGEGGKVQIKSDQKLYKAKAICYAMVNEAGEQEFDGIDGRLKPEAAAGQINRLWNGPQIDAAFGAVDELNLLTRGAQERAGKASGTTTTTAG